MTISEIPAAIATCAFYIMMIFLAVLSFPVVFIISVVESFPGRRRILRTFLKNFALNKNGHYSAA